MYLDPVNGFTSRENCGEEKREKLMLLLHFIQSKSSPGEKETLKEARADAQH
jgi:hypothetical protein